jgi:hypothetical protein
MTEKFRKAKAPQEKTLRSEELSIERKSFVLSLKENHRGRFVRITEQTGANHSTIIIPTDGLDAFIEKLTALRSSG